MYSWIAHTFRKGLQIKRDGTPDGSAIFEESQSVLDHPVGFRDGEVMVTVGVFCIFVGLV